MKKGELLDKMLLIATVNHAGQFDKGGSPYILHPLAVFYMLNTDDEELQCIALGHDLIEDTSVTYEMLAQSGMTNRIIEGIRAITKVDGQSYDEYKQQVFGNRDAMYVKQCDLRHNSDLRRLKGVTTRDMERVIKYNQFYAEIQERLENDNGQ